jgi:molybdopterin biosynthesis enzyme
MAQKEALIITPEDREEIPAGEIIDIQLLSQDSFLYLANQ